MIYLHIHTNYSDGSSSVKEVLEEAERLSLKYISITDHNILSAYNDLNDIRKIFSGEIINGCEITTTYNKEVIEILGYGFDIPTMKELLKQNVLTSEQKQFKEFALIKKRYKEIGVIFNEENIIFDPKKESCRSPLVNEIKKYPENYSFFLEKSSIDSRSGFTRNEVFNPKSPLYVDESSLFPSLEKVLDIIHKSGGLSFLAHTFAYSPTIFKELDNITSNYEIDGIECYYTTFTNEETQYLLDYCEKHNLYMSGGSDFHGVNKVNHNMGIGFGNMKIDDTLISSWNKNNKIYKKTIYNV